ncbi:MAG: phosphohydrolase [Alkaliphilus sp.]|nr:HDIG domain-containing protein [bacterium AH-315-G05]MBN4074723.1 HDIG domain-containing protein [bacterium AH-315-E09]PHS36616.1 MAG: phosphohydrolase [Alkaliphilus sp.]
MLTSKKSIHALLALLFFISVVSFLVLALMPEKHNLAVGTLSPVDIHATRDIINIRETDQLRQRAAGDAESVFRIDPMVLTAVNKDIENFFEFLYSVIEDDGLDLPAKKEIVLLNKLNIPSHILSLAVASPIDELEYLESFTHETVSLFLLKGLKIQDLQLEKNNIREHITEFDGFNDMYKELAISIINATIRPNSFLDIVATEQKKIEAKNEIEDIIIREGDIVVGEGEIILSNNLVILSELGLLEGDKTADIMLFIGVALIILVMQILLITYMKIFSETILSKSGQLLLLIIIFFITLIMARATSGISIYLMPTAASVMLIALLINARLALLINLCVTILIAMFTDINLSVIFMTLLGGTAGVFSINNANQRGKIFIAGLVVGLVQSLAIIGFGLVNMTDLYDLLTFAFLALLNGVFCSVLTVGSLPLWESIFGILTKIKLLELSSQNHPLLKKLMIEAPGTYHHSIIVGNLSEAAANAVGANALLARVGSFYHDIGKTSRPYFFKENQLTTENPHDKITPSLSTLIITGHVKDGMEMAKKHKLPVEIQDFIIQHHGTSLVAYFYHKAKELADGEDVDEQSYRYNGIKPQTKETAIVMFADSVEAAIRSLSSPTEEKIKAFITKIIKDKLDDGQMDECDLTLKELEIIKQTFVKTIMGTFHERIEYPDNKKIEAKGRKTVELSN